MSNFSLSKLVLTGTILEIINRIEFLVDAIGILDRVPVSTYLSKK